MLTDKAITHSRPVGLARTAELDAACKAIGVRLCGAGSGYPHVARLPIKTHFWMSVQAPWQPDDSGIVVAATFAGLLALVATRDALTEAHLLDFADAERRAMTKALHDLNAAYRDYGAAVVAHVRHGIEQGEGNAALFAESARLYNDSLASLSRIRPAYDDYLSACAALFVLLERERARIRNAWLEYDAASARSA